jgi:phosphate transport system substrate-binding protein
MAPLLNNLAIAFESIHEEFDVEVRQGGSAVGIDELCAGRAAAAAESRALRPEDRQRIEQATGRRVIEVPVALDGICVYVHAENPLPSLTADQCNGIFSMTHTKTAAPLFRWSQVDPASPLKDEFLPIYVLNEKSGTMQAFRDWCMPGELLTTSMRFVEPGPSSIVNACCAYPTAMGVAGFANAQPRARAVPLVPSGGGPAVAPGVTTIRDGSYPLSRPLTLVFLATPSGDAPPELADLCRFALSEVGQDLVTSLGCVPPHLDRVPAEIGRVEGDAWIVPPPPAPRK